MWLSERRRLRAMPASRLLARREEGEAGNSSRPSCLGEQEPRGGEEMMMVEEEEDVGEGILYFILFSPPFFFFFFFSLIFFSALCFLWEVRMFVKRQKRNNMCVSPS